MPIIPDSRPRLTRESALQRIKAAHGYIPRANEVLLVGIRGYYHDQTSQNQRGIYDDAIAIIGPEHFSAYNANTDPSIQRKGIATLLPGIHPYRPGNHGISRPGGGYPAFRPATRDEALPVSRDGIAGKASPGIAINIHRGGNGTTSSEGCQTIPPAQWDAFHATLRDQMKRYAQKAFNYVLVA